MPLASIHQIADKVLSRKPARGSDRKRDKAALGCVGSALETPDEGCGS